MILKPLAATLSLAVLSVPLGALAQEPPRPAPAEAPPAAPGAPPSSGSPATPPASEVPPQGQETPAPRPGESGAVDPQALQRRVDDLEQKVHALESRQAEPEKPKPADKKQVTGIAFAYGNDGVSIKSSDGQFQFRLRPIVQADGRFFKQGGTDTFLLRRVRPVIEGTVFQFFDWRMMPELSGTPNVQDAYVNIRLVKEAQLRGGKFKPPVGIERLASDTDLPLIERGLTTNLVPDRDVGIMLHGDVLDGTILYAAGFFNGVGDGVNGDTDNNDAKDFVGRIFVHPFRPTPVEPLHKLGLGVAATRGTQINAMPGYRTSGQATFFQYASSALASGTHRRVAPQAYFYLGPFGAFGEYVRASQIVTNGTALERVDHEAWEVVASIFVTGEDASYTTVTPRAPLDPANGTFGAIEIAGRYGELSIDPETYRLKFADPNTSPSKAKAWAVGVNWHLARNFKFMADYERTNYEGGAKSGDKPAEIVLLTRLQAAY
jgi:phosphate-selective porin OprO/OprP